MQGQGFPSSCLQPAKRWPSPQEGGEPQQVGGGGDLGTVVRRQENNSKWVGEVIMGTEIRMEVNSSRWVGEVTTCFGSLVGCESVRLNPASIGSWLGSIDSHSLV